MTKGFLSVVRKKGSITVPLTDLYSSQNRSNPIRKFMALIDYLCTVLCLIEKRSA